MRITAAFIILLLGALVTHNALAEPDRDSLVEAWEAHIAARPSTVLFESVGDGVYRLEDSDLPYEGELKVVGALVRSADTTGYDTGFNYLGMIDFQLSDMPAERLSSQVFLLLAQRSPNAALFRRSAALGRHRRLSGVDIRHL